MNPNIIYWKEEPAERTWKPIPNTPEARQHAIKQGAMFFTSSALSEAYKGNGQPEPIRTGDLVVDADCAEDPGKALQATKTLCLGHLPEMYGIDPYAIRFYASGSKGFHAEIPASLLGAEAGDSLLPLIYKRIMADWVQKLALYNGGQKPLIDLSMYCMGMGKMFRIATVKRSNGRYKVPLTLEEIRDLSIDQLMDLTKAPREVEPPIDPDLSASEELENLFKTTKYYVHKEIKDRPEAPPLSEEARKRLSEGLPPCISQILSNPPAKTAVINFNRLTMLIVSFFHTVGSARTTALTQAKHFIENYTDSDSYNSVDKRQQHFEKMWNYIEGNDKHPFHCKYMLSLRLSGFDCKACAIGDQTEPTPIHIVYEDLSGWLTEDPPEQKWCFEDVVPKGIIGGINATGGTGKTYFIESLMIGSAFGREAFGLFKPEKPLRVLAHLGEDPADVTRRRLHAIAKTFSGEPKELETVLIENLRLVANRPGPLMEFDGKGNPVPSQMFRAIQKEAEQFRPDVIFIDPKAQYYGLDENSNDHNTSWVNLLKTLTYDGPTLLFTHHIPKGQDAFNPQSFRGGGALVDGSRWAMGMKVMEEATAAKYDIADPWRYVHCKMTKNSYAPLDGKDIFFKRTETGALDLCLLTQTYLSRVADRIKDVLVEYYQDGGEELTKRDFIYSPKTKTLRDLVKDEFPKVNREKLAQAVTEGIKKGILAEVESSEKPQSGFAAKILKPAGLGW